MLIAEMFPEQVETEKQIYAAVGDGFKIINIHWRNSHSIEALIKTGPGHYFTITANGSRDEIVSQIKAHMRL